MHSGFTVGATWQPSFVDTAHTPAKASEGKQLAHSCYAVVSDMQNLFFFAVTGIEPAMLCTRGECSTTTPSRPIKPANMNVKTKQFKLGVKGMSQLKKQQK